MSTDGPTVAIAVVSWNTRELLRACLRSFEPDHLAGLAEVWVLDNASTDGSAEMVGEDFPWVSLIASERNLGFGPGVNEVAARTRAPWIAPANADIELRGPALRTLLSTGERDPSAGIVAPRLLLEDGSTQHSVHRVPSVGLALAFNLGLGHVSSTWGERLLLEGRWNPDLERPVPWAHGAFLLVRRAAFDEIGGFDPRQWMYAEDLDLAWRLARAGWSTQYQPRAVVLHAVSAAAIQAFGDGRVMRHTVATSEWMASRKGRPAAIAYALINLAGTSVRWLGAAALSVISHRRALRRDQLRGFAGAHLAGLRAALR